MSAAGNAVGRRPTVRIFQSYGWRDATEIAVQLRHSLAEAGYDVWIDHENLREDDKFFSIALEKAVKDCEVLVALLSPHSVRGGREEDDRASICYNEIMLANTLVKPVVPIRVQNYAGPPPFLIINYRAIKLLEWKEPETYRKGVAEILDTIERVASGDKNFHPDINFQVTNFAAQLNTARASFVGRQWLFARIDEWLAGDQKCMVLEGVAGSGKTAIVAELVRRNPGGRILGYHFCSGLSATLQPASFVRSLSGMLASSIDVYGEKLWDKELARLFRDADAHAMLSQGMLAPLHAIAMETVSYIVVDALDEAAEAASAGTLSIPQLLATVLPEFPAWLKLLVTTRPHGSIQRLFSGSLKCLLGDTSEGQRVDLRTYLERRFAESGLRAIMGPDRQAQETAITLIEERSAGNFQFADSVLAALRDKEITPAQLDQLPRELEGLYYRRAEVRFPKAADYKAARLILSFLLAAREPLTAGQIADMSGLDQFDAVRPTLNLLSCFVGSDLRAGEEEVYRPTHKSITDWLVSPAAASYRVDVRPGRAGILAYCRDWAGNRQPYALKHLIAHLVEAEVAEEALGALKQGLFTVRQTLLAEPRLDTEDSRNLTLALVRGRKKAPIVELAKTESIWQRDGVAAALQSTQPEDDAFIDDIVGALLEAKA